MGRSGEMKSVELNPDELPSAYALIHFVPSLYLTGLSCACNDRVRDDPVYCAKAVGVSPSKSHVMCYGGVE